MTKLGAPKETGMSLVTVLVAIGLTGGLSLIVATVMKNQSSGNTKSDLDIDRMATKRMLLDRVVCSKTALLPNCAANIGKLVSLIDSKDNVLISDKGTMYGRWAYRAECSSTGILIRNARIKNLSAIKSSSAADFLPDPLTGQILKWSDNKSLLFPIGIEICSTSGGSQKSGLNVFNVNGTFKVPPGVTQLTVELWGGGGGGSSGTTNARGGGGGAGGYSKSIVDVTAGSSINVTVGSGGQGGTSCGGGRSGGETRFLTTSASGGAGSPYCASACWNGGDGGQATGTLTVEGGSGTQGQVQFSGLGYGGDSPNGGAGGRQYTTTSSTGPAGKAPGGAGAGGGITTGGCSSGGNGANGRVVVSY